MTRRTRALLVVPLLAVLAAAGVLPAAAQEMPDPRRMSGVPLAVGDVPAGTVTVRVIRGSFANPVASQTVELLGTGRQTSAATNDIGRAEFTGLTPGTRVKAAATVGGQRLESQEFAVPANGGIRLILVAEPPAGEVPAAPSAAAPSAPAQRGSVGLGADSRFVFELGEDGLSVFYVLQIENPAAYPVDPGGPIAFDLPDAARGAAVLQGSSPQASVAGRRMQIAGPFAPGATMVQLAYTIPYSGPTVAIEQRLPVPLAHLAIVAQKTGDMRLASPQIAEQRDMPANGNLYIAARGGAVPAGGVLRFDFSGMPYQPTWPRTVALVLAAGVLAAGAWASLRSHAGHTPVAARRESLEGARNRLFDELTELERRHREQSVDAAAYAERRQELVSALERVYTALDGDLAVGRAS